MASTHFEPPIGAHAMMVDGVPIAEIVTAGTGAQIAEVLLEASQTQRAVIPCGGRTKALGNVPARADLAVSTAGLNRVLHYEPTDMTLSVEGGVPLAELKSLLAERGQTLPVEAPHEELATIGGMIATAMAGPRRFGSGTLRDLLIGIAIAYPDGTVGKAGGLVVKNVTGFDLMRLHLGALGTLGVIVSANFKVLPIARAEATVLTEPLPLDDALRIAAATRAGRLRPIALEIDRIQPGWIVAARFEGRPQTVELGLASARTVAAWRETLVDDESTSWWRTYVDRQSLESGDDILIRCGVEPKAHAALVTQTLDALAGLGVTPTLCAISPGLGAVTLRYDGGAELADVQAALLGIAETVTILKAPAAAKLTVDVWGTRPETISVMRALKSEFDPENVLNPGRFVDRI